MGRSAGVHHCPKRPSGCEAMACVGVPPPPLPPPTQHPLRAQACPPPRPSLSPLPHPQNTGSGSGNTRTSSRRRRGFPMLRPPPPRPRVPIRSESVVRLGPDVCGWPVGALRLGLGQRLRACVSGTWLVCRCCPILLPPGPGTGCGGSRAERLPSHPGALPENRRERAVSVTSFLQPPPRCMVPNSHATLSEVGGCGGLRTRKRGETRGGRPERGGGVGRTNRKTTPATTTTTNSWAPLPRKPHHKKWRPLWPSEHSDPTQHAKGRTGDCPGPRKQTAPRRNVTQGGRGSRTPPLM